MVPLGRKKVAKKYFSVKAEWARAPKALWVLETLSLAGLAVKR